MASFIVDIYSFSPNGVYLASYNHTERQILIRKCDSKQDTNNIFKVCYQFSLKSSKSQVPSVPVDDLVWSPDSCFLGVSCKKYAAISVFSVLNPEWKCKVTLGQDIHGLESLIWAKDARHLLCMAGDMSFLSIWSIRSMKVQYIKNTCPIRSCAGISPSPDGRYLAVAHLSSSISKSCSYHVGIYSTPSKSSWTISFQFSVIAKDIAGLCWSVESVSDYLCVWDSNLFSNLYVYEVKTGALIKHYSPYGMSSCGFNAAYWTPSGAIVCTVQNRNELHVLNGLTFGVMIHDVLEPEMSIDFGKERGQGHYEIFYEANKSPSLGMNQYLRLSKWPSITLDSTSLLTSEAHLASPRPTTRVKLSPDGAFLACITRYYPQVLWIYDLISTATLNTVLIHQHPVSDFSWNPNVQNSSNKLAVVCKTTNSIRPLIYFWTSKANAYPSVYMHNTTAKFSFSEVEWSPHGDVLLLRDTLQRIHLLTNL